MAKKCGHRGRIERRHRSGPMHCHRQNRKVNIAVKEGANYCTDTRCVCSPMYVASEPSVK